MEKSDSKAFELLIQAADNGIAKVYNPRIVIFASGLCLNNFFLFGSGRLAD